MKNIVRKVGRIALILGLFAFPGYDLLMHVVSGAAAQIISGVIYTSPVVVPGSFSFNGGPQVSAVKANGGTLTCTNGGTITVTNTNLTANSVILFGMNTKGGTPAVPTLTTVTPGTSFVVTCGGSDSTIYNYIILG